MFRDIPREYIYPLKKEDHPEIYTTEEQDQTVIKIYQPIVGSSQWAISLGCFDIDNYERGSLLYSA
jgi:hypothetical protein